MRAYIAAALIGFTIIGFATARAETLVERFAKLSCAVVHIHAGSEFGTGFFTDDTGTLATAAHVISQRSCAEDRDPCGLNVRLNTPITLTFSDGHSQQLDPATITDKNRQTAQYDVLSIATGIKHSCFISLSYGSKPSATGEALIAIGFPGFSPFPVLYSGFLSANNLDDPARLPVIDKTAKITGIHSIPRSVMRVQIPITSGVSGSPVINDANEVIGIVVENPIPEIADLTRLIQAQLQQQPMARVIIGGFDTNKVLAEIAYILTGFVSSGAAYAVPISYLAY